MTSSSALLFSATTSMMISSQLLSTVSVILLFHPFFWFPVVSSIALKVDWTGNPPQPIFTGNTHALYHLQRLPELVLWFVSLVSLLASLFQWDNKLYQDDPLALLGPKYNAMRRWCPDIGFLFPGISWLMSLTDNLLLQSWWIWYLSSATILLLFPPWDICLLTKYLFMPPSVYALC